jgi:hypothetical protein
MYDTPHTKATDIVLAAGTDLDALNRDDVQVLRAGVVGAVHHRCHLQTICEHNVGGMFIWSTAR